MSLVSPSSRKPAHVVDSHRMILVSNRGPVEYRFNDRGMLEQHPAGGGVAVALSSLADSVPVTWVAGARTMADQVIARLGSRPRIGTGSSLRFVDLPQDVYESFYSGFCNPLLWFIQHSMAGQLQADNLEQDAADSWRDGYVAANQRFADAILEEVGRSEIGAGVMLHDYHLYLVARMVRSARPDVALQLFVHIPWPGPEAWDCLPGGIVRELCRGILANDSVSFQTEDSAQNFVATCEAYLSAEVEISANRGSLTCDGHHTQVWHNPVSVDPVELRGLAASREVTTYRRRLTCGSGMQTIVRVDRLDPAKNALAGFQAYEMLLERRPDLRGRVRFLACLVPSRRGIPEYDSYSNRVLALVHSINRRYGSEGWEPIVLLHEENRMQALAALTLYDVLLVNSTADGMNLVCKEGPVINQSNGVLILSRGAGAHSELRRGALDLDPADVAMTSERLEQALSLSAGERATKAKLQRDAIERHQASDWLRHQLADLRYISHQRSLANAVA